MLPSIVHEDETGSKADINRRHDKTHSLIDQAIPGQPDSDPPPDPQDQTGASEHPAREFELTDEQHAAVGGGVELIAERKADAVSIAGSAGSGKTTVTRRLKSWFEARGLTVGLATPTHKAGHVLARACGVAKGEVLTFAALLGLREKKIGGEIRFERDHRVPVRLDEADVWICDEASMLAPDLLELMLSEGKQFRVSFVFVGDHHQLPPVGHVDTSPALRQPHRFELTQVHRHAGAVLDYANAIRTSDVHWRVALPSGSNSWDGSTITAYEHWCQSALRMAKEHNGNHPDMFRVLCFRNENAAKTNAAIRRHIYGPDAPAFVPDERLITLCAVVDPRRLNAPPIYGSSRELKVIDTEQEDFRFSAPGMAELVFNSWQLVVRSEDDDFPRRIRTIDPADAPRLNATLNTLASQARAAQRFGHRGAWKHFWVLRESIAQLGGHWALTVHRSQGSQFHNVFIDTYDLDTAPDQHPWKVRRALWYVALTRAQHNVHLIADPAACGQG